MTGSQVRILFAAPALSRFVRSATHPRCTQGILFCGVSARPELCAKLDRRPLRFLVRSRALEHCATKNSTAEAAQVLSGPSLERPKSWEETPKGGQTKQIWKAARKCAVISSRAATCPY